MNNRGFTLVELLISALIFVLIMAAASNVFTALLTQFKQQSKIGETNIEGIIGLEILRQDLVNAGYGLPRNIIGINDSDGDGNFWEHLSNYDEAISWGSPDPSNFNDATKNLDADAYDGEQPRALVSGDSVNFSGSNNILNGSDYLVIKAINVADNEACRKWTTLKVGDEKKIWEPKTENLKDTDKVIILSPGGTETNLMSLVVDNSGNYFTTYNNTSNFAPTNNNETRSIYGIDPEVNLRMPFNRADYFIWRFDSSGKNITPQKCAPNTGVLIKAVLNHSDGKFKDFLPLLDCVADMQVIYRFDMNQDGIIGTASNADGSIIADIDGGEGATVTTVQDALNRASIMKNVLKEVRVYILAHEGQKDLNFGYQSNTVTVGEYGLGRIFNLSTSIGYPEYRYYRWKVFTIVVSPLNLR